MFAPEESHKSGSTRKPVNAFPFGLAFLNKSVLGMHADISVSFVS